MYIIWVKYMVCFKSKYFDKQMRLRKKIPLITSQLKNFDTGYALFRQTFLCSLYSLFFPEMQQLTE